MRIFFCLFALLATGTLAAADLMQDCKPGSGKAEMKCINRNGVCVEVTIDGHPTTAISRADRQRLAAIPDMDELCWQVVAPVSAQFRVQARGGGVYPSFVGAIDSLGPLILPIEDFDPEFDRRVEPLSEFDLEADGYRDGTWQLKARTHFRTPGSGVLNPGEYVLVLRVHGSDNWDKQEILLRIDPDLQPAPASPGHKPE